MGAENAGRVTHAPPKWPLGFDCESDSMPLHHERVLTSKSRRFGQLHPGVAFASRASGIEGPRWMPLIYFPRTMP